MFMSLLINKELHELANDKAMHKYQKHLADSYLRVQSHFISHVNVKNMKICFLL